MNWENYFIQGIELLFLGIGSYFDIKNRELPVELFYIFGSLGIMCNIFLKYQTIQSIVLGCGIGVLCLLIGKVTKEQIGYGDGLGLWVLGIFEGFGGLLPIAFGAFCCSAVYGFWKMFGLKQKLCATMPFYPFLFLALVWVIVL